MTDVTELVLRIKADSAQLNSEMKKVNGIVRKTSTDVNQSANSMKSSFDGVRGSLSSIVPVLASALSVRKIIEYSDEWKRLTGRLRLVTEGTDGLAEAQNRLFKLAQDTRSDLSATVILYQRVTLAAKTLGKSQEELFLFTEQVNKQMRVGGLASSEAASATLQLTQALNKGNLSGDEFRTLMESMPPVIEALSVSLGVSKGQIIEMSAAGKLSAEAIIKAVNDMANVTNERFSKLPVTIEESFTRLNNAFLVYLGSSKDVDAGSRIVISALNTMTDHIDLLAKAGIALAAIISTRLTISLGLAATALAPVTVALGALAATFVILSGNTNTAAQTADEYTRSLENQATALGKVGKFVEIASKAYQELNIRAAGFLSGADSDVVDEAILNMMTNGRASFTKGKTVDEITFIKKPKKEISPAVPRASEIKTIQNAKKSLDEYTLSLTRMSEASLKTQQEQAGLEAYYKTMDLGQKSGIKNVDELAKKNQTLVEGTFALKEAQDEAQRSAEVMRDTLSEGLTNAIIDFKSAGDAAQNFARAIAASIITKSVTAPLSNALVGNGSAGSGLFSGIGKLFGFARGADNIPNDMVAQIHKGEMIIPAAQASAIRNGSGGGSGNSVVVNQYFQVSNDVPALIDAKIRSSAPLIASAAHEAVFATMQRGGAASKLIGAR